MGIMIILIKSFLFSWFITRFEPLQMIIEALPNKLVWNMIKLLFSCSKCLVFWVTTIMTGDIFIASGMSLFMVIFEKTFGRWENKVYL